jgi:hypothetical protein
MIASSISVRSSCLRSRSLVVGADQTRPRSVPSASSRSRSCSGERPGSLLLAQRELRLGCGECSERVLPVAFKAARDEPVLGLDLAVAALGTLSLIVGAVDLQPPLLERGVVILLERLGRPECGLHADGRERGQKRARDRLVDLSAADPQTPAAAVVDQDARGAVIGGALVTAPTLVVDLQLAPAAPADGDPLQQRGAFADRAAGLVCTRARVGGDPFAVGVEGGLVDEAGVVFPDQDLPFCLGQATHPLTRLAVLIDVALAAGLPERVRARVDGVLEHAVDLVVGRHDPLDLGVAEAAHRKLHPLAAHPQPHLADGPELGEALEDRRDRAADRFVGVDQDLAVLLTPDQPDRQAAAQLATCGLVADPALKAGAQDVQLGLAHRALQPEQQPVVERAGVIEPVAVADHRVGHAAQIKQPIPVDVVARQARDLQAEHQAGAAERDLRGQPGEPRAVRQARAGDPEILVDHDDVLAREPQLDRAPRARTGARSTRRCAQAAPARTGARTPTRCGADARRSASGARSLRLRAPLCQLRELQQLKRELARL